jgi:saccharopine dehydrogenase-like NADP-dependent oxidoreductase
MLDNEPVEFGGVKIVPREFLLSRIEPRLKARPGDTDVCVMYNTVTGTKNGVRTRITYWLWDEADPVAGISSMGRVTGFSAAIGAVMIGKGLIKEKGIVPPEDCIYGGLYDMFMKELEKRNIHVLETIEAVS